MAIAKNITLLSLDRFAEILGINPAHFNQGTATTVMPMLTNCPDIYYQFAWQRADCVSREEIARGITQAEQEIADVLGFYPAPKFIAKEIHMFPRHYRPDVYSRGLNVRFQRVSSQLNYGRLIQPGRRTTTAVETGVTVVYSDEDGDGYDEIATVIAATSLTDASEIKVYYAGENANEEFEIRHPMKKEIVGGAFTATFFTWQLIDPDNWFQLTGSLPAGNAKLSPLKLTDTSIYVSTVDVFREFADFTRPSAQFFFENDICTSCNDTGENGDGTRCGACELRIQDGCFFPRNVDEGIAVPVPAMFDTDTGQWVEREFIDCRAADQVRLWYQAGDIDNRFLQGSTTDPLKLYWAEAITWLTVARLPRPLCSCGTVEKEVSMLRRDMAVTEPDGLSAVLSERDLDNPFGTRRGEIRAWRRVNDLARKRAKVAVI